MMSNSESIQPGSTEYGIPIRNLWHMLLYAWNEAPLNDLRNWALQDSFVENAPTLDALLASVLIRLMQQRLRIGLGHEYTSEAGTLHGIRGRIQFGESIRQHALERGQVTCESQAYPATAPRNQFVRSTIARLLKVGHFGPNPELANEA